MNTKIIFAEKLSLLSLVHSRVLFYPFHFFYLQIINNKSDDETEINEFVTSKIVIAFTAIMMIINFSFALAKELFFFQVIKSKNAYCAKNNSHSSLLFFYKALLPILMVFISDGQGKSILIAVISIALSLVALSNIYIRLPFYKISLLKCSYTLLSLNLTISILGSDIKRTEILLIICSALVIKIFNLHLNSKFDKIMAGNFSNAEQAIHYPLLLKQFTSTGLNLKQRVFASSAVYY